MKQTEQIRKYIECPQFGNNYYGKWGALTWEQRKLIAELCNKCDIFENSADSFAKQNDILKAFIKTHHPEIAQINDITLDVVVKATDEQLREENKQLKERIAELEKENRNQCTGTCKRVLQ